MDSSSEKIGAKIRLAQLEKVAYMIVVGPKEEENQVVSVRHRNRGDLGVMPRQEALDMITGEIRERRL
jgi:threonyl-tRNA synthetase